MTRGDFHPGRRRWIARVAFETRELYGAEAEKRLGEIIATSRHAEERDEAAGLLRGIRHGNRARAARRFRLAAAVAVARPRARGKTRRAHRRRRPARGRPTAAGAPGARSRGAR